MLKEAIECRALFSDLHVTTAWENKKISLVECNVYVRGNSGRDVSQN